MENDDFNAAVSADYVTTNYLVVSGTAVDFEKLEEFQEQTFTVSHYEFEILEKLQTLTYTNVFITFFLILIILLMVRKKK